MTLREVQNTSTAPVVENGEPLVTILVRTLAFALTGLGTSTLSPPQCFPYIVTRDVRLPYYSSERNFLIIPNS